MLKCRIVGIGFSIVKYGDLCLREATRIQLLLAENLTVNL
jgi:hypothetical protein